MQLLETLLSDAEERQAELYLIDEFKKEPTTGKAPDLKRRQIP